MDLSKWFNLYKFELSKFCKKGVVIGYLIVIVVSVVLTATYMKINNTFTRDYAGSSDETWRYNLETIISHNEQVLADPSASNSGSFRQRLEAENARLQWYLDNNIRPYSSQSASTLVTYISIIFPVVIILTMLITAKVVVDDFSGGTALGLFTIPMKRWKILLTKLLVIVSSAVVISLLIFLLSIFVGWIFFGFDSFSAPYLIYSGGKVVAINVLLQGLYQLLLTSFALVFCSLVAVAVGLIFKHALISGLLGIGFYFFGSIVAAKFINYYDWMKYLPFLNMNFGYYFDNTFRLPASMSVGFSVLMLLAYIVPLGVACFVINKKQQIK